MTAPSDAQLESRNDFHNSRRESFSFRGGLQEVGHAANKKAPDQ